MNVLARLIDLAAGAVIWIVCRIWPEDLDDLDR